ncbi:hypothetical protein Tco_0779938 [Tanacetum coccineum]
MVSLDRRLNPLYAIKECSSCGALYTSDYCCSKGGLEDKILVPKTPDSSQRPPQDCVKCGNPVEDLLNTYESSDDDTNVVNAPQKPFVVKQDPGKNSSQSPPQIDHNCCYECGDSLDGIFCQRCTCKSCGKGAHIGYNCPPKAPIISNPEPCNQTIDELPQTLPSFDPTCYSEKENSLPYVSKPNFVDDSPNVFNPPPQPPMYSCEFCGNDARYGHYCTPQVPFIYPEPCYNQDFNFPQDFHDFQQQYLCCENCGGPHETFQCQPMNEDYYHEQNSCYDSNSFGFDQFQPPQYTVNHPIFNAQNELLNSQNKIMEQMTSICDMVGQYMQKKEEDRRIAEDQAAKDRYWKIPICYDDDEDYTIAITPVLLTGQFIQKKEEEKRIEEEQAAKDQYWKIPVCYDDNDDEESSIPLKDIISKLPPRINTVLFQGPCPNPSESEDFFQSHVPKTGSKCEVLNLSHPLFDLDEEITSTKVDQIDDEVLESIDSIPSGIEYLCFMPNPDLLRIFAFIGDLRLKILKRSMHFLGMEFRLLYDNSSPRPPKDSTSDVSDAITESCSPYPIPIEDIDSLMEEIDLFLTPDDSMPPGIETDDYDFEGDILFFEELLTDDSLSLLEHESFHFESGYDPSSPGPLAKPQDDDEIEPNTGLLTTKVVGDISEHYILIPRLLPTQPTLCPVIQTLLPFSSKNVDRVHLLLIGALKLPSCLSIKARC